MLYIKLKACGQQFNPMGEQAMRLNKNWLQRGSEEDIIQVSNMKWQEQLTGGTPQVGHNRQSRQCHCQ